MVKKIANTNKERPYIYFSVTVVLLLILLYSGFTTSLNAYLHSQISKEASALAKSNSTTIVTFDSSIKAVQDLLVSQLKNTAELLINTSSPDNIARNDLLSRNHLVDEINWGSKDGTILYSSKDYEGESFDLDHFFWTFIVSSDEYAIEDVRKDVLTDNYYLHLYMRAPNDTIIQVGILADRIIELFHEFSIENIISQTLQNENVVEAVVYMDSQTIALSSIYGDNTNNLTDEQMELLKSQTEVSIQTTRNGESVLEVYSSIDDEFGYHVGSFLLTYSLSQTERFVNNVATSILIFIILITIIFLALTYSLYNREKKIIDAPYTDPDTNIMTSEFIRLNYKSIKESLATKNTTIAVFYISNYRRIQILKSHDETIIDLKHFVDILKKHSESQELYRYQDDIFFMLSHHRSEEEILTSIQNVISDINFNYEIKTALIKDAAGYEDVESLFESYKVTAMQLKESTDLSKVVVTDDIHNELIKRQAIERDLRLLSVHGFWNQLYPVFQPQVNTENGDIVGFEMLTRWIHPEYGLVHPTLIFEIAESTDYYNSLIRWTLIQALEFMAV